MHYKAIRRSHKGRDLPGTSQGWLVTKRKEEIALEKRLAAELREARRTGQCPALTLPTPETSTPYRTTPETHGHICGEPATLRGYCTRHFITHILYVRDRQSARAGAGLTRRPFVASELPIARLSDAQIDLMHDLERLPMKTPLEDCITALNEVDPANPVSATRRTRK